MNAFHKSINLEYAFNFLYGSSIKSIHYILAFNILIYDNYMQLICRLTKPNWKLICMCHTLAINYETPTAPTPTELCEIKCSIDSN